MKRSQMTSLTLDQFDYHLPADRIAQTPLAQRDQSKLLHLDKQTGAITHKKFTDIIDMLQPGDILVANNSRVIPARLYGRKPTGGKAEILLLEQLDDTRWRGLVGGKKMREGTTIHLHDQAGQATDISATITAVTDTAERELTFSQPTDDWLHTVGHIPLPPYIHQRLDNNERYQTIYNRNEGSAAAPTAGLHFTPNVLLSLREKGVLFETVTLHIGLDTFKPVSVDQITEHPIHTEWATLTPEAAQRINEAKLAGGRLIAIGTTSVRTLETAALYSAGLTPPFNTISRRDTAGDTSDFCPWKPVAAFSQPTDLYLYPGYKFRAVDAMITNFHMPKSTLMMLVSAFAGRDPIMNAYQSALNNDYRFLSLGDAMFIA